jgi:glycine hydroxymethyltransferase
MTAPEDGAAPPSVPDGPDPHETARRLEGLVAEHEAFRASCLNLVAAENVMSPRARALLDSDLSSRYGDYVGRDPAARKYFGTAVMVEIEALVDALLRRLFDAPFIEARALSGHVAGSAAVLALTEPGDVVLELDSPGGGHRIAEKLNATHHARLDVRSLPFDPVEYTVDVHATVEVVRALRPRMVILGSSLFLFPHPLRALATALEDQAETVIAYDASHVLGLMAGHRFQDPLREGAPLVWASTHKIFPGPPGGLVMSTSDALMDRIAPAVYPGLVTNHNPGRMPALGYAAAEMLAFGEAYSDAIVANARRLGAEVDARGVPVVARERGYTASHTLLLAVAAFGTAREVGMRLEAAGVVTTATRLPPSLGGAGIRLGLQELTRRGATPDDMPDVAGAIADAVLGRRPVEMVRSRTRDLAARFARVGFTFGA